MITLFMHYKLLHILQVILMSVDSGLFCAISLTSLGVSVGINHNMS